MEKNNSSRSDDVFEIDLNEYYYKLKANYKFIVKCTFCTMILAIIYIFIIAKPIYEYTAMIRLPKDVNLNQVNGFVSIIRDDIKPDEELDDKYNKITDAILIKDSSVIKVTFEGESAEKVRNIGDKYISKTINYINKVIVEEEDKKFTQEILWLINNDVRYIAGKLHESNFSNNDAIERINYLYNQVAEKEKHKMFLRAELAKEAYIPEEPIRPKKILVFVISSILGAFLSSIYVIIKKK